MRREITTNLEVVLTATFPEELPYQECIEYVRAALKMGTERWVVLGGGSDVTISTRQLGACGTTRATTEATR